MSGPDPVERFGLDLICHPIVIWSQNFMGANAMSKRLKEIAATVPIEASIRVSGFSSSLDYAEAMLSHFFEV